VATTDDDYGGLGARFYSACIERRLPGRAVIRLLCGGKRLVDDGPITNSDVRQATALDRVESLAILNRLVKNGRLIRTGERRGTKYRRPQAAR
jgi:hypothetical protein